jgi:o-succinylbenzoate synthase
MRRGAVSYRLRTALETSRGPVRERTGARVEIFDEDGHRGAGEALPLPDFGTESPAECDTALARVRAALEGESGSLDALLDRVEAAAPDAPAARCAVDIALHDLEGQRRGIPVAALLSDAPRLAVRVSALLGGDALEADIRIAAAIARGQDTFKLKIGGAPAPEETRRILAMRARLGRTLRLRLDANGAWSADEAIERLAVLAPLDIELVEQPVAASDLAGMRRVHAASRIPIAADESLARAEGRHALVRGDLASIAVLKPMLLGGLRASARLARDATRAGVRCFVTTTFEGPVGTAAAAHLAAAVSDPSLANGLPSIDWIHARFPEELEPDEGCLRISTDPGLGLEELE